MKSKLFALALIVISGCGSAMTSSDNEQAVAKKGVDTQLCIVGSHWGTTACKCVPTVCTDTKLCVVGKHWDTTACDCVANAVCTDTKLCVVGKHWDTTACDCVADAVCTDTKLC